MVDPSTQSQSPSRRPSFERRQSLGGSAPALSQASELHPVEKSAKHLQGAGAGFVESFFERHMNTCIVGLFCLAIACTAVYFYLALTRPLQPHGTGTDKFG